MSKKDYSNYSVEFALEESTSSLREVFWRINPKELSWWERVFKNPWHKLYHSCFYHMSPFFGTKEYMRVKRLKTYSDVINYIKEEEQKTQKEHDECVDRGIIWEDEPIYN